MSQQYFTILTALGRAKLAEAVSLGTTLKLTHMAVGDGGGAVPTPVESQIKLKKEVYRGAINTLDIDDANHAQIMAELIITEAIGDFYIREVGLFLEDGTLFAVGSCPESYKPLLSSGSGRTQTIRMLIEVSNTESVKLLIDPSTVLASRQFVEQIFAGTMRCFKAGEKLPSENIGPIWHADYGSIMEWVIFNQNGAKYTGYASIEIGRIPNETQPTLRKGYIRSGASSYNQTAYSALWNWAKHNSLVKSKNEWQPKTLNYRDNGDGTFTPPDLRDQFPRFTTDGREFGSFQGDAIRNITGQFWDILYQNYGKTQIEEKGACGSGLGVFEAGATEWDNGINVNQAAAYAPPIGASTVTLANDGITFDASRVVPTSYENRSVNTDFLAAIKY